MLTAAQIVLVALTGLVMFLVIVRYRQKRIGTLSFVLWLSVWGGAIVVILFPNVTMVIARLLGIGRGADLALYLSVILLLYLLYRVAIRLERMDREITQIVRHLALKGGGAGPAEDPRQQTPDHP